MTVLACHACAERERTAYNRNVGREPDQPPAFGQFFIANLEGGES